MVFGVHVIENPFDCIIVGKGSRSSSNRVKSKIHNSLVGQLAVLDIKEVIIVKNCVNPRPLNLVSVSDSSTDVRENTKFWVLG